MKILLFAILSASSFAQAHNGTETLIHAWGHDYSFTDLTVDGLEDDWQWWSAWEDSPIQTVRWYSQEDEDDPAPGDFYGYYYISWDWPPGTLAIFARVYDDVLVQAEYEWDMERWFRNDSLWLFIDPDHSGGPWDPNDDTGNVYAMAFRPILDSASDWDSISPFVCCYSWGPLNHWASRPEFTEFASQIDTLEDGMVTYTYEARIQLFNDTFEFADSHSEDYPEEEDFFPGFDWKSEGEVIGLSISLTDADNETENDLTLWGIAGGETRWMEGDHLGDVITSGFYIHVDIWPCIGSDCDPFIPPDPPPCPCHEVDDDSALKWTSWRPIDEDSRRVANLTFSPDGHTLAGSVTDRVVRLWDVSTGKLQATLEGHPYWSYDGSRSNSVAFSPDGYTLATGGYDDTIRLKDVQTGHNDTIRYDERTPAYDDLSEGIRALAFSPDGSKIASAHKDFWLRLWDVETGRLLTTDRGVPRPCTSLAFSPDGTLLACGNSPGGLDLYEVSPEGLQKVYSPPRGTAGRWIDYIRRGIGTVSFSPDGSKLAWGLDWGYGTRLWDLASNRQMTLQDTGPVAFSPDGLTLAIGPSDVDSGNTIIRLWDAETGQHKATLEGPPSKSNFLAFSPDGTLASASHDGILLWDLPPSITDPSEITAVSVVGPAVPANSGLDAIAPNPFNATTRISYRMATPGPVRLEIYNTLGQRVRTLVDEAQPAGSYQVLWNARDQQGAVVSAGVYVARLHHREGDETRRLLFLK